MMIRDLSPSYRIRPLKLALRDVPHLVIEPTLACNLACRICYNRTRGADKSLAQIESEIEVGLQKRKLRTVSILGGEPTLHPDLPEIVRLVKTRGLACRILTNGVALRSDPGSMLLDALIAAGLDRILFHVDIGQYASEAEADAVACELAGKAEARRLFFSLAMTVYPENRRTLPEVVLRFASYRYFEGVLSVLARDALSEVPTHVDSTAGPNLLGEYQALRDRLGIEPASYLPTSLDDEQVSWLMYFYCMNARTGATLDLSTILRGPLRFSVRSFVGQYPLSMSFGPGWLPVSLAAMLPVGAALGHGFAARFWRVARDSEGWKALRFHYILVQQPPRYSTADRSPQLCYHCPDATIRHGMLTPVCVADFINPWDPNQRREAWADTLYRAVYDHLAEL